jgi:hypothetical protein
MIFRNFKGGHLIEQLAQRFPYRAERLGDALEDFVRGDPATGRAGPGTPLIRIDVAGVVVEVYLVPPREFLRAVPDSAALVRIDWQSQTVEIVEVIDEYVEATEQDWIDLVARARRAVNLNGQV